MMQLTVDFLGTLTAGLCVVLLLRGLVGIIASRSSWVAPAFF